jgi:neurofibromin 1
MATIFLKGIRYNNAKDTIYQALTVFLDIESKQDASTVVDVQTLGYLGSLLPLAVKNESLRDVLRLSGLPADDESVQGETTSSTTCYYRGLFDKLDIPDDTTALLLISMMATSLFSAESESERLLLYGLLAEAAVSMPHVFRLVYDSLLPKMNQVVLSSNTQPIIESVKTILLIACSDPNFNTAATKSQHEWLQQIGFSALAEPNFGASSTNVMQHSKLASEVIERIIA